MSEPFDTDALSQSQLLQINKICNDFEAAWSNGQPSIQDFVERESDARLRAVLLHYLIELDIECREANGCLLSAEAYVSQFAEVKTDWVNSRFGAAAGNPSNTVPVSVEIDDSGLDLSAEELLERLRSSQLVADKDLSGSIADVDMTSASAFEIGQVLVDAKFLTDFQLDSICRRPVDPLVLGDYVLLEQIGEGGMGTVYRAMHRRMKRVVALKVLKTDVAHAEELSRRFVREVQVAAQLSHPNIVTAYDAGEQHGLSYLVCEFIDGQNLAEVIKENGPLGLPDAVDVTVQMAEGLAYAHAKSVIHRDIKPSNLLLDDEGNAKLLDVGLAKLNTPDSGSDDDTDLTKTGLIMGTVDYMAPEQAQNTRLADERSDIYSVGCTLHYLLTGRAPYSGGTSIERLLAHRDNPVPSLLALNECVPDDLQVLLERCLAKNPVNRFQSASELLEQLKAIADSGLPEITLPFVDAVPVGATKVEPWTDAKDNASDLLNGAAVQPVNGNDQVETVLDSGLDGRITPKSAQTRKSIPWLLILLSAIVLLPVVWSQFPEGNNPVAIAQMLEAQQLGLLSTEDAKLYQESWQQVIGDTQSGLPQVDLVVIPPGEFVANARSLVMDRPLLMSSTEITVGAYRAFVGETGHVSQSEKTGGYGFDRANRRWVSASEFGWNSLGDIVVTDRLPAAGISYDDAMAYCAWATEVTKLTVRLPNEIEWEYASRAGRPGYWCSETSEALQDYAWVLANSGQELFEVAQKRPNFWGLYDMHGSESEWCSALPDAVQAPLRGGSYSSAARECTHGWRKLQRKSQIVHGAFRIVVEPKL